MRRELLPKEEYYRPKRAADLQRRADLLERWAWRLEFWQRYPTWKSVLVLFLISLLAYLPFVVVWIVWGINIGFLAGGITALPALPALLRKRVDRHREAAAALEAEHQARYGELPPGEQQPEAPALISTSPSSS